MDQEEERHPTIQAVVDRVKSEGIFDAFRKECLHDVNTKPAYVNLRLRVENYCASFLAKQTWSPSLNKNQLREQLRQQLNESGMLQSGVRRLVSQVIAPKVDTVLKPKVAQVVCECMGLNPDDLDRHIDETTDPAMMTDMSHPPPPVSLFPFNPLEPPPPASGPPPLPGFESSNPPPPPSPPPLPPGAEDKAEDMDMEISDQSDNENRRGSQSKNVISDDESRDAPADSGDLSKGLAAYMAEQESSSVRSTEKEKKLDTQRTKSKPSEEKSKKSAGSGRKSTKASESQSSVESRKSTETPSEPVVERRSSRRHRTLNKKYLSDDFTSIFTEKKELLGDAYSEAVIEEEVIMAGDILTVQLEDCSENSVVLDTTNTGTIDPNNEEHEASGESRPESAASKESGRSSSAGVSAKDIKTSSQHYDQSDLYKPRRYSRRRSARNTGEEPVFQSLEIPIRRRAKKITIALASNTPPTGTSSRSSLNISTSSTAVEQEDALSKSTGVSKPPEPAGDDMELSSPGSTFELHYEDTLSPSVVCEQEIIPLPPKDDPAIPTHPSEDLPPPPPDDDVPPPPPDDIPLPPMEVIEITDVVSEEITGQLDDDDDDTEPVYEVVDYISESPEQGSASIPDESIGSPASPEDSASNYGTPQAPSPQHTSTANSLDLEVSPVVEEYVDAVRSPNYLDSRSAVQLSEGEQASGDEGVAEDSEEEDRQELERLAQRKLEILKAIELPDEPKEKIVKQVSSEEEGQITDSSSEEEIRARKSKSKKKKSKKSKKDSRKRKHRDYESSSSKRSKYY